MFDWKEEMVKARKRLCEKFNLDAEKTFPKGIDDLEIIYITVKRDGKIVHKGMY